MAPKKKSSGATDRVGDDPSVFDSTPPLVISPDVVHYVALDLRRHGPIADLKICKGHFSEANEMTSDMDTQQDYGIEGAPEEEPEVLSIVHYDFKPQQHDNPLLLATEQQ
ncbi:hypothetical protein FI667_g14180, partial [Globisporangium splendens]